MATAEAIELNNTHGQSTPPAPVHPDVGVEERYRIITEMLSDIICETDTSGIATYISPSCKRVLGYAPEQLIGKTIFDLVHPDDVSNALIAFHNAVAYHGEGKAEFRYRTLTGAYLWMEAVGRAICDWDGTVRGTMIICRDIGERVAKARELRIQSSLRQAALNSTDNGLFAVDTEYRYTVFNRYHAETMDRLYGSTIHIGMSILDAIRNEAERAGIKQFLDTLFAGTKPEPQCFAFDAQGTPMFCEVSGNAIRDRGVIVGAVVVSRNVTERRKSDERRNEQLFLLSSLFDGIPVPIFYKDREKRFWGLNKAFEEFFGRSREQLIGKTVYELFPQEQADELNELNDRVLATQAPVVYPTSLVNARGELAQIIVHLAPFEDRTGQPAGLIGVLIDITELNQAQRQLRASLEEKEALVRELQLQRAYFKQLFDASPEAIAILDTDGNIVDVNAAFEQLFQFSGDEVRGKRFKELIVPQEQWDDEAARWDPKEATGLLRTETIRIRKDGSRFPVAISAAPIILNEHRLGVCAIYQDLTARKVSEAKLKQLSRAVEQSPASIVITDTTGAIQYVNPKFCAITGYTPDEVIGKNPRILKSGLTPPEVYVSMWKALSDGQEWIGELCNKTKHGDLYWELAHISPITDENGVITHYLGVKEDITERKHVESIRAELEAALRKRNEELQQSIEQTKKMQSGLIQSEKMASLGLLTAGIAHEINNPLAFISSNLNRFDEYFHDALGLLNQWKKLGEAARLPETHADAFARLCEEEETVNLPFIREDFKNLMQHAREGIDRIRSIVEQLRGFSHMGSEVTDDVSVERALDDTILLAWNEIKYKATVVKDYGEIPPVRCSAGELKQVLVNLIVNAAHAIEKAGTITLRTTVSDHHAVIQIEDTGCGIPPEHLPRIFDPFFTTKPVGKGTGLGLWISATIVQKYGGTISVDSTVGVGTTFTLRLPLPERATQ